jgi:hypothetical protein
MMSEDDGGRKIGEGPYEGEGRQATLAEKRVSLTVEFKIAFREITPETALNRSTKDWHRQVLPDTSVSATKLML